MQEDTPLLQAIAAARAGRELTARDMFLDIVRNEPRNEVAWMWLTGLLDDPEDCIQACQRILEINPNNAPIRQYLGKLLEDKQKELGTKQAHAEDLARAVREAARLNKPEGSLETIRDLTRQEYVSLDAWRLLAEQTPDMDEQIGALEKLLLIAPGDAQAKRELDRIQHIRENPLELAAQHEEQGNIDQAITMYSLAMQNANSKDQWNQLYSKIAGLENQKRESITHVNPEVSIARQAFTPSLLYFVLMLIQVGINPFAFHDPLSWIGLPWVVLGGCMIALASVNTHNRVWVLLFKDPDAKTTPATRSIMTLGGWLFVLVPYLVLFTSGIIQLLNVILK
jgi:tetratricopeptide (TPR) repeat protein